MTIGIDISALQSGHRMRGIGFTIINFINHISEEDRKKHRFIFFMIDEDNNPLKLLDLNGMDYDVRFLDQKNGSEPKVFTRKRQNLQRKFPSRLQKLLTSSSNQLKELLDRYMGSSQIKDTSGIDVFIQPDQSRSLPRGSRTKKVLIIYDIIPYVLEWEYLWSYNTARLKGFPRKTALRCRVRRWLYLKKLKVNTRRADILLAISQHTKDDFVRFVGIESKKIKVTHLGVSHTDSEHEQPVKYKRYIETSWGYSPRTYNLDSGIPFLLFVGGADQRRKLDHLVTAFNHLRAQGEDIKLILAGDTMQGSRNIPTLSIQNALQNSSYLDDIIFMGFVSDKVRESLYKRALAFVYPSTYEGFGLPVLEAMSYGCPVISYKNQATLEVAGNAPIYTSDAMGIKHAIRSLLNDSSLQKTLREKGYIQSSKYKWEDTSRHILQSILY